MATEKFKLQLMPLAYDDLDSLFDYISINLSAPLAARNLMRKIEEGMQQLTRMPHSAPKCMDAALSRRGYRKLVIENYVAIYSVDEENMTVLVMRVFYGRSKYEQLV